MLGARLKEIREGKKLSQGDIEKISGLKRCYVSRVENGHTVPAVETLEKLARALGVPMYRLFYTGEDRPSPLQRRPGEKNVWGSRGKHHRYLERLSLALRKMTPDDRELILMMTHRVAQRSHRIKTAGN